MTLRGIVKMKDGYRAMFEAKTAPPKTFTLQAGARLFDANVLEIAADRVVLRQDHDEGCTTVVRSLPQPPPR
jgi:hypothetical protein